MKDKKSDNSPRNDLTTVQSLPEIILDLLESDIIAELLLHSCLPSEDFLVGKSKE